MGARDCTRASASSARRSRTIPSASMGARDCTRASVERRRRIDAVRRASMGARDCTRASVTVATTRFPPTVTLQWGRAIVRAQARDGLRHEGRLRLGFNGGARLYARKRRGAPDGARATRRASMGARDCTRASLRPRWALERMGSASMGARDCTRASRLHHVGDIRIVVLLQWGRAIVRAQAAKSKCLAIACTIPSVFEHPYRIGARVPSDDARVRQKARPHAVERP